MDTEEKIPRYDVEVELVGTDGNVFALIGRVAKALRQAGEPAAAETFRTEAMDCGSYDDVLVLICRTVEVA